MNDLEEFLLKNAPDQYKTKMDSPDPKHLKKLLKACEKYDMDEVDAVMAEIEKCEYSNDEGLALWLRENVNQMNFRQIVERLTAKT